MREDFKSVLLEARRKGIAVGAFNIFNHLSADAVMCAAQRGNVPVIVQTSVSTVRQIGVKKLAAMLLGLRESYGEVPVLLHLDHCRDPALAKACVDNGWDAVMIDGSHLALEENIALTRDVALYAHGAGVQVEGELGAIFGVEDDVASAETVLADYASSERFVRETDIDAFAPAIGTVHGLYKNAPAINYELAGLLCALPVPLVVHGGTGLSDDSFKRLIGLGMSKVNISTALKHAYIDALKDSLQTGSGYDPLKLDGAVRQALVDSVASHINLFSGG